LITSRIVQPSWKLLASIPLDPWVSTLPDEDPLRVTAAQLHQALAQVRWASPKGRKRGVCCGSRVLLLHDYDALDLITDDDLRALPLNTSGIDLLDAALCELRILPRSAQRGTARRHTSSPHTIEELAAVVPEPFRPVTIAYLSAAEVLPHHARGFVDWALPKARTLQRDSAAVNPPRRRSWRVNGTVGGT
jgi:hypothetical protein